MRVYDVEGISNTDWISVSEGLNIACGDYLVLDMQPRVGVAKYDKGFYMEKDGDKFGVVSNYTPLNKNIKYKVMGDLE